MKNLVWRFGILDKYKKPCSDAELFLYLSKDIKVSGFGRLTQTGSLMNRTYKCAIATDGASNNGAGTIMYHISVHQLFT